MKLALENPENYAAAGLFAASHTDEKPCCDAMESALMRAYGDDIASGNRLIEEKAGADINICHFACGDADAATRKLFENAAAYRFESFGGSDDWENREKMLLRFIETLSIPAPEVPVR